ncbi:MAG TPA: TonB-dependent receptor [Pyrinomonadaceae bacterium]|nr:TonB-dependent receptor [Pyrinomonadaceae bacterium]
MTSLLALPFLLLSIVLPALAQTQTTGRIAGTVKDQTGAVILGAEAVVVNRATAEERRTKTNDEGNYAVSLLPPGLYQISISASGFKQVVIDNVRVAITETTQIDADLTVGSVIEASLTIRNAAPGAQTDGPRLGRIVESRAVSELPLATRNFTQILGLSPGADIGLADNTGVGRNSQNISVNGARRTQNNFQINGVDANTVGTNSALFIAVPAPETIQEFKLQTSLYDATFGRSGGGNLQAVTKSGSNSLHGAVYDYFRIDSLNANNPFLKAADVERPPLRRNVFGATLGGPITEEKAFFFVSYQHTHERNGASINSVSPSVLIAQGLTNDRSEQTLRSTFNLPSIHPVALALLNARLSDTRLLIPTPQADGRYSGWALSHFQEDQFNSNIDYRINEKNWLATKFFFADAPWTLAMFNGPNVPGFDDERQLNHRLISIQNIHTFSSKVVNEARAGYNFVRNNSFPEQPIKDSDVGISRPNAASFPGLPLIRIAPNARGLTFGTGFANIDLRATHHSATVADVLSIIRGGHTIRTGADVLQYQVTIALNFFRRGQIDFNSFTDFLRGNASVSFLGSGIHDRNLRTTDYSFFIQDDWKLSPRLTINLGLRYELNPSFYDTRGRISTFDPSLYKPRVLVNSAGVPQGPPIAGFVQAGNVIPAYDLPEVPNVSKRLVTSIDPNNFAPRVGFAYSPLASSRLVVRSGYGIFYSRGSSGPLNNIQTPPTYLVGTRLAPPSLADPFLNVPATDKFPTLVPGATLTGQFLDRNVRTPYFHQYNASVQYVVGKDLLLEVAYVGTRGLNLPRVVAINQARLAGPQHPLVNSVTGAVITTNTPQNAQLRAPIQGVSIVTFGQAQTTANSTYNALQISLTRQLSKGLRVLASYTFAKSIDNASGRDEFDFSTILGNQLDNRANRGVSDFDRTHRFVLSYLWDIPQPVLAAKSTAARFLLSNWEVGGIFVAMSGQPIDIVDTGAGSFYGLNNGTNPLARPNWAPGATRSTATSNIPAGYFFNPFAFVRPVVAANQLIPSSNGSAIANAVGTDIGNVGRNVLRGPRQSNVDFSIIKRFPFRESKNIEMRAEFFNLFNQVNLSNPISDFNAVFATGSFDPNTGRIINPGDFGRITSTSNNPRLIQFALKLNF